MASDCLDNGLFLGGRRGAPKKKSKAKRKMDLSFLKYNRKFQLFLREIIDNELNEIQNMELPAAVSSIMSKA